MPASLFSDTVFDGDDILCPANGGNSGEGYSWILPTRFALQLRGPFSSTVQTSISSNRSFSVLPCKGLLVLFKVIMYKVCRIICGFGNLSTLLGMISN